MVTRNLTKKLIYLRWSVAPKIWIYGTSVHRVPHSRTAEAQHPADADSERTRDRRGNGRRASRSKNGSGTRWSLEDNLQLGAVLRRRGFRRSERGQCGILCRRPPGTTHLGILCRRPPGTTHPVQTASGNYSVWNPVQRPSGNYSAPWDSSKRRIEGEQSLWWELTLGTTKLPFSPGSCIRSRKRPGTKNSSRRRSGTRWPLKTSGSKCVSGVAITTAFPTQNAAAILPLSANPHFHIPPQKKKSTGPESFSFKSSHKHPMIPMMTS